MVFLHNQTRSSGAGEIGFEWDAVPLASVRPPCCRKRRSVAWTIDQLPRATTRILTGRTTRLLSRNFLSLFETLYDCCIVGRHMGVELTDLGRLRAIPSAVH